MVGPEGYDPFWDDIPREHGMGHYNRQGEHISFRQWVQIHEDEGMDGIRRVAEDHVEGVLWVSTIFLGLNMRIGPGPPLIFETMVFLDDAYTDRLHDVEDFGTHRYATERAAIVGHRRQVRKAYEWVAANTVTDQLLNRLLRTKRDGDDGP